ncbi:MAG: LLM class flavin-dependent oxidoreductase [Ectothiorhodospiraceae bacterium]|nr:LLM class flavin-dependent oxidoreductase [Chromatiales bacterium]MCP5155509.1 LLM class flavin-dependent oxidoreductase [Ectothiorhodospiraceae bacterium]
MDISLGLYPDTPAASLVDTARRAERHGLSAVWLADSHLLWREPYVLLGAMALATERVRLATCVTNPVTRHPSVTAAAFVTLAELSGGRATLGISIGDSALRTLGMRPVTVDRLAGCIAELRALIRGDDAGQGTGIRYADGCRLPIAVAASGPRMLALAGALADEVVLMNGVAPDLVGAACRLVDDGARQAGRDPAAVRRVVWAACHMSQDDPARSLDRCRYNVARAILRDLPGNDDPLTLEVAARIRERYDYAAHGDPGAAFATLVPDALVPRFTFAGTPADVRARILELEALGIDEVALAVPRDPDAAGRDRVVECIGATLVAARGE